MKLFLSYASEYRTEAAEIALAVTGAGQEVISDEVWLKPGDDYNRRIRDAFDQVDGLNFLISPESVEASSYALEVPFERVSEIFARISQRRTTYPRHRQ